MREPLFDFMDEYFGKIRTIEEKTIKKSRADVIGVMDDAILGFEIKSDSDTYTRLKTQIKDYETFCDECYIVIGKSHIHADEHIPEYWGIIEVSEDGARLMRDALPCPNTKMYDQLLLLWKRELWELLDKNELPKYRNKSRKFIIEKLLERVEEDALKRQITDTLFERDYTIFDDQPKANLKTSGGRVKKRSIRKRRPKTYTKHTITGRRKKK